MGIKEEKCAPSDIILVLEATANMVSHWDQIKKLYIVPAITQFHKQARGSSDFVTSGHGNRFCLILFHAADKTPDSLTQCLPPTERVNEFFSMLDSVPFTGGGSEHFSHLTEGLATALQLFNDLKESRNNHDVSRYCFVITNSPPYEIECIESYVYAGCSSKEICNKLKDLGVKMSVICPRHITELQQVYSQINTDQKQPKALMNYALDKRHLVLVNGFQLPTEKEPVPVSEITKEELSDIKPSEIAMDVTISSSSHVKVSNSITDKQLSSFPPSVNSGQGNPQDPSNIALETLKPSLSQPQVSQVQTSSNNLSFMADQKPNIDKNIFSTSVNPATPTNPSTVTNTQIYFTQTFNIASSMSQKMIQTKNQMPSSSITSNQMISGQQPMIHQPAVSSLPNMSSQNNNDYSAAQSNMSSQNNNDYSAAQKEAMNAVNAAEHQTHPTAISTSTITSPEIKSIWAGNLEWFEKRKLPDGSQHKIPHLITCQIYQTTTNTPNNTGINTNLWPPKLTMQIIPQSLIQPPNVYNHLRSSKYVVFKFSQNQNYQMLVANMQKETCGLINFMPDQTQSENKLIIIILKKKDDRNTIVGLIPEDPTAVMNAIRTVATATKQQTRNKIMVKNITGNMQPNAAMVQNIRAENASTSNMSGTQMGGLPQYRQPNHQTFGQQTQTFRHQNNQAQQAIQMNPIPGTTQRMNQPQINNMQRIVNMPNSTPNPRFSVPQSNLNINIPSGINNPQLNMTGGGNILQTSGMQSNQSLMSRMPGNISNQQSHQNAMHMTQMQQQRHTVTVPANRPNLHQQPQLRHLLRNNSNVQQTSGVMTIRGQETNMGQTGQGQMPQQQQQNFMPRSNMMPNIGNSRPY